MKENNSATSSIFISIGAVILGLLMFTQCGYGGTSSSSYSSSSSSYTSSHKCYICGEPASKKYGSYYYCPSCYSTMKSIADSYGY